MDLITYGENVWDRDLIFNMFHPNIAREILPSHMEQIPLFGYPPKAGLFSVKSAY